MQCSSNNDNIHNNDTNKSGYNRDANNKNNNNNNNDLYLADLLHMTDHKLLELQREVEQSQRHAHHAQDECVSLKKQVCVSHHGLQDHVLDW